ncbi:MAG: hypothetical protein GY953_22905, partial [bacterium]|nr:hypothetical protein [bacterium]
MKALVLSAGGMFGAWQAGVWAGIEHAFRPDIVVGASVGSLNGWLIASGAPASELLRRWREVDEFGQIRWRVPRSVLGGVINPDGLERQLRGLTQEHTPRLRFGVVATRLPRLRPTLFQTGLTWRHLAASCAVPILLPARALEDGRYWDGGLLGPVQLWAAAKMGATEAVVINALHPVPRTVR